MNLSLHLMHLSIRMRSTLCTDYCTFMCECSCACLYACMSCVLMFVIISLNNVMLLKSHIIKNIIYILLTTNYDFLSRDKFIGENRSI